jgi:hypothetical protein
MKKCVFYPILFSTIPILLMYLVNINGLPISLLFPTIFLAALISLGLIWLFFKYNKDVHRSGFVIFILTFWFFYYIPFRVWVSNIDTESISFSSHWIVFPIWSLFFLFISSSWLWKKISSPQTITFFLNIVCIVLISFSIVRISLKLISRYVQPASIQDTKFQVISPKNMVLHDIYYIILDAYARKDVIKDLYHFDNSGFIQELTNRGFFVASKSESNYMQTPLSLVSALNMRYVTGTPKTIPNHGYLMGIIDHSLARTFLESLGYKFVTFSTGFLPSDITDADYYFSSPSIGNSNDLVALLLVNSALAPFIEQGWIKAPVTRFKTSQERFNYILDTLDNKIPLIKDPKFVFVHILPPHPPFVFDQNGPINPDDPFIMQDAYSYKGSALDYIHGYDAELTYINKRLLQTIDGIIANSASSPIIILQADHGPDAFLDWNSISNSCLKERFSILNAYYLPDQNSLRVPDDITPVNTFSIIFNAYFGTQFGILQNHQYFATWENPFPFTDVTEVSQTQCKTP